MTQKRIKKGQLAVGSALLLYPLIAQAGKVCWLMFGSLICINW